MSKKLNQILAIEKGVKTRVYSEVSELHKISQKPDNFNGFSKTYRKKDEESEDLPADRKKVQVEAKDQLARVAELFTEIFDVTATKDYANCDAKADVVIDGQVVVEQAPATLLLFLEKQLTDYHTYVSKLPTLDENEDWLQDPNSGLYKTPSIETHRTKKVQKPLVLYPATEQHPAQTQLVTEDVIAGYWDTVKQSGAMPVPRKRELLERTEKLLQAVKTAREAANMAEAPDKQIGAALFAYLLK